MSFVEIDGVGYTEAQIRRALEIEKDVRTPGFFRRVLEEAYEQSEFENTSTKGVV